MNEQNQSTALDVAGGEVPNESTELAIPGHGVDATFESIAKRDGVAPGLSVKCSYDASTADGQGFLARANVSQAGEESKLPYYGKSFMMVAWTSMIRVQKKDKKTGNVLPEPRPVIRTVIECLDGTEIASASSYVFADLRQIQMAHPNMSLENPVECILYKGGGADRLKDVKASAKRMVAK